MKAYLGGGWAIHHLSDRCIELKKEDYTYRRFLNRDGYVRIRAEPGMSRHDLVNTAVEIAQRNDAELALRVGKRLAPSLQSLAEYSGKQVRLAKAFATPEDESIIGRQRP